MTPTVSRLALESITGGCRRPMGLPQSLAAMTAHVPPGRNPACIAEGHPGRSGTGTAVAAPETENVVSLRAVRRTFAREPRASHNIPVRSAQDGVIAPRA